MIGEREDAADSLRHGQASMEFDTRTAMIASVVNVAMLGVLALWLSGRGPSTRSIRSWGVALLVFGIGLASLALRGAIPAFFSIALANTLVIGAVALGLRSLRGFVGVPPSDPVSWVLVATVFAINVAYARPEIDYKLRVVTLSVGMAILFARGALLLHASVPTHARRSFGFTEIVLWLCGAMMLARAVLVLFERSVDLMEPTLPHVGIFLLAGAFATAATFGFMWMANEGLQGELEHLAAYDPLTQVLNRRAFLAQFEREVSRSKRERTAFSLAIFDLDRFKRINDAYGHPAGDRALQSVVATMRAGLRKHDVVGRYGGEEFALLMPNTANDTARQVAERIRADIERRGFEVDSRRITLTVSGGLATYPLNGEDWDALLTAADNALYDAKTAGRNRVVAARAPEPLASNG
jgi:diguanylate cyclase (GGDEF)-like protein